MLQPALHSSKIRWQFFRYLAIGSTVFVIDVGSFQLLMRERVILALSATLSYGLGLCVHFALNKYYNFRSHDRAVTSQVTTYLVVAFALWLTTLAVVEIGFRVFGLTPLVSKVLAVAVNIPLGFLGHRCLTFGGGISAQLKRLMTHPKSGAL